MFNKFRNIENTWPYYEPLHHDIWKLKAASLDIWKYNKKATQVMSHPELDKPHFYEYKDAFDESGSIPYYDTKFAYEEYVSPPEELYNYVAHLISSAPSNTVPVLQFNRTSLRVKYFKDNFPAGLHIYLLRNPLNQFESYLHRGKIGKNIFLAINILIILNNRDDIFLDVLSNVKYDANQDIYENLNFAMRLSQSMSVKEHYTLFLHIWFSSLINALEYSDFVLDMDKIANSKNYVVAAEKMFADYDPHATINFDDYSLKKYSIYSMPSADYATETRSIYNFYASKSESINSTFTYYYIDSVLARASQNNTSSWFNRIVKAIRPS